MRKNKRLITEDELFAIGNRIALARYDKKLRSNEVAAMVGVTPLYYSRIETGVLLASTAVYIAICEVLGVSLSYIIQGDTRSNYVKRVQSIFEGCEESDIEMAISVLKLILGR